MKKSVRDMELITVLASTTGPFLSPPPPPPPPYTPFTNYPHLLLTPINCLPPFIIYPHLLFTPIYYLPPFTINHHLPPLLLYPFYYFSGIKTHRKSFRRFIFSSKHSHLMSKMTGIRNSYVEILRNLRKILASTVIRNSVKNPKSPYSGALKTMLKLS